jgi:transcriptional regulator with XRE-family HTH domain
MAKYANIWEPVDVSVMRIFNRAREASKIKISDRAIAKAINVSPPRVADLFNHRHGSPTLREFIALCEFFGLTPSDTIQAAINNAASDENTIDEDLLDEIVANPDGYDIAALRDPNKEIERETPRE